MSAPSAPQIVPRPRPATSSIQFYWQPPASDGGSPIIKYTLACASPPYSQDISANQATYTVTGLTTGIYYTFTLTATNANGESSPATFRTVQVGTTTFGPTFATASTLSTTTALVTWDLSTIAGSANVEWITIRCLPSTTAMSSFVVTEEPFRYSTLVEGLSTNIYYRFLVQAVNDVGYCPPFAFTSTLGFGLPVEFSPANVAGIYTWFDAADRRFFSTTTVSASNNVVHRWFNKANSTINIATRSNTTPYILANQQNGLSTISFSGGAYLTGSFNTTHTGQHFNAFFVGRHLASPQYARALSAGEYGQADNNNFLYLSLMERQNDSQYGTQRNSYFMAQAVTTGTYHMVTMRQSNAGGSYSINGSNLPSTTYSPQASGLRLSSFAIGNRTFFDAPWNGNVGEIIMYSNDITYYDLRKIEGYLAWKWGLQNNLAVTHLYRLTQPTNTTVFRPSMYGGGMQLWLDVSDSSTFSFSSGSTISQWRDKSSTLRHANGGTGTVRISTFQGRPVVDFTQTGLLSTSAISYANYSSFCVCVVGCRSLSFQQFMVGNPTNHRITYYDPGNGILSIQGGPGLGADPGQLGQNTININGGREALNVSTLSNVHLLSFSIQSSNTGFFLGGAGNFTNTWRGHMYEMMIFTPQNTTSGPYASGDVQVIEGYMAWRWGLQGLLPSSHPFKNARP